MAVLTILTIDDFERLPDELAQNHELVEGELVDVSGNVGDHVALQITLIEVIGPYVRQKRLGRILAEQEFQFGENANGPDVSFLVSEKVKLEFDIAAVKRA